MVYGMIINWKIDEEHDYSLHYPHTISLSLLFIVIHRKLTRSQDHGIIATLARGQYCQIKNSKKAMFFFFKCLIIKGHKGLATPMNHTRSS